MPLSFLAALAVAALTLAAAAAFTTSSRPTLAILAVVTGGVTLPMSVGVQWYLVRTRVQRPLSQLEAELLGRATPSSEPDALTGSLRDCIARVRDDASQAKKQVKAEQEKSRECQQRLSEREAFDALTAEAAVLLPLSSSLEEFAAAACRLATLVWPAGDVLFLERGGDEKALVVLAGSRAGAALEREELAVVMSEHPYAATSLPSSLKAALLTGESVALGLPFSDDPRLPTARSFVALALEHKGVRNGFLYLASSQLEPPSPAPLTALRGYLGLAYSRAHYTAAVQGAANRDVLTGALTQASFRRTLENEIVRSNRYGREVACALLDLDNLRRINQAHGSHAGDAVVAETARLIQEQIRASDQLARVFGGTFALVMPETSLEVALVAVERIRGRVQEHVYLVQRRQVERMTLSAGIAAHPSLGATALAVYDAAQDAMLAAKRLGRNRVLAANGE